jgi:small-conductance mechanosensitive channel
MLGGNYGHFLWTVILLMGMVLLYSIIFYWIKKGAWERSKKRRASISIRNTLVFIFIMGIIIMWGGEIKTMIFSITALAAAILIAFKELLLCVMGSILITSNQLFSIGDYIEVDGIKGKVVDKHFIYTKIIIYEQFQTKSMNIPNIVFLTTKTINLSNYGKFQSYVLNLAVPNFNKIKLFAEEVEILISEALSKHDAKYNEYIVHKKESDIFFDVPKRNFFIEYDLSNNKNGIIKLHYLSLPLDHNEIKNYVLEGYSKKLELENIKIEKGTE